MGKGSKEIKDILLLENDPQYASVLVAKVHAVSHPHYQYRVTAVQDVEAAEKAIAERRYAFLLVDLLLGKESSESCQTEITLADVQNPEHGSKIARRLLLHHRNQYNEKPRDSWQLRPIIYSAAKPSSEQEELIKTQILCDGSYDFIYKLWGDDMSQVIHSLSDMCALQEEMTRMTTGESWISQVMHDLGCGISIISTNWKIFYCSEKNAHFSNLDLDAFHDEVCWRAYHHFEGLDTPCPECAAAFVMMSDKCKDPEGRFYKCPIERYPCKDIDRSCSFPDCVGNNCPGVGSSLSSYSNCRLLLMADGEPQWVHVTATPLFGSDRKRIIGALETVVEVDRVYQGFKDMEQLDGRLSVEDRLEPVLHLIRWLGHKRARVFRHSPGGREMVGIKELGNELRIPRFLGYRFPASESLVQVFENKSVTTGAIRQGPGYNHVELGKTHCKQFMEFVLHKEPSLSHKSDGSAVGTLAVDDVCRKDGQHGGEAFSNRIYTDDDVARLRPVAAHIAHILALQEECDSEASLRRHASSLRSLEKALSQYVRETEHLPFAEQCEGIRVKIARDASMALAAEPELLGCHFRFLVNERLKFFPGTGEYSLRPRNEAVSPGDPHSISAKAFRTRENQFADKNHPPFKEFCLKLEERQSAGEDVSKALEWSRRVQSLGCFPIHFGSIGIGTLAVQSEAVGFFSIESLDFIKSICDLVARFLGPAIEKGAFHSIWENAAYAFQGPANHLMGILDILVTTGASDAQELLEEALALSAYLVSKADTFFLQLESWQVIKPRAEKVALGDLWKEWCLLFRTMSRSFSNLPKQVLFPSSLDPAAAATELCTDRQLMTEVVFNIFENAVKASNEKVEIGIAQQADGIRLTFDDDGRGLSPEAYSHLSQSFTQGNEWQPFREDFGVGAIRGFGLGLKFTHRHIGPLKATVKPERFGPLGGARFVLTIPFTMSD